MATKRERDACDLLDADHKQVKKLFTQFDELSGSNAQRSKAQRLELAQEICRQLTAHATVEEEIFYPALRSAIEETDLVAEAEVEHASAKALIAQIEACSEVDEAFDAMVKVLGEYIDHHVKEERGEMFPKARSARKLDLVAMRGELEARKESLLAEEVA